MGWGDDVMTTDIVRKANIKTGKLVLVGDGSSIHWSPVFDGNPRLSRTIEPDCVWVKSYPGHRPYIDVIENDRYVFNDSFRVEPGELYISRLEKSDYVYIEPNIKGELGINKDWGFENWQKVVDGLPEIRFLQGSGRRLDRVEQVETASFLDACRVLSGARLFVGTDGGLHHAAAALSLPAVVVWTGFSPSKVLGYDNHINLQADVKACGKFGECEHCKDAARQITVENVYESVLRLISVSV